MFCFCGDLNVNGLGDRGRVLLTGFAVADLMFNFKKFFYQVIVGGISNKMSNTLIADMDEEGDVGLVETGVFLNRNIRK